MMKNKFALLINLIILIFIFCSTNEGIPQSMPEARNTIYFSIGMFPPAVSVSLNYERMISLNASIRAGINLLVVGMDGEDLSNSYYASLPITVNYLTSGNSKFELGAGAGPIIPLTHQTDKIFPLLPAGSIGYRYQLESKSIFFKAGLELPAAPMLNFGGFGYHF